MIKFHVCKECGSEFKSWTGCSARQEMCPECRQWRSASHRERDQVTLSREQVFAAPVKVNSLPGEWTRHDPIKSNATGYWKIEARGSQYGKSWDGQITVFSHMQEPPRPGDVVFMRLMTATKAVKKIEFFRDTNGRCTLNTVILPIWTTEGDLIKRLESGRLPPEAVDGILQDATVEHEYIVLNGTYKEPRYDLVWGEATTKTTLKGFGAQYRSEINLNDAYWYQSIYGGGRGGRAHTTGTLALVPIGEQRACDGIHMSDVAGSGQQPDDWEMDYPEIREVTDEELLGASTLAKLHEAEEE